MNPAPQFAVTHDGVRVAFRAEGPSDAPALLLCTMATAAMSIWDGIADTLSTYWRVIRHDRRGDGDSDPGTRESHTFANYAADALCVMDACGCEAATVCGMAFGARVAMRLALDAPSRVRDLVLFDATGAPAASEAERAAGQRQAARLRAAAGIAEAPREQHWFHRRDASGAQFLQNTRIGQPDWLPGLGAIRARTLVACGDCDPNLEGSRRLAREIAGAAFALMPMTGHASLLERPDLVLALLQDFMEAPRHALRQSP